MEETYEEKRIREAREYKELMGRNLQFVGNVPNNQYRDVLYDILKECGFGLGTLFIGRHYDDYGNFISEGNSIWVEKNPSDEILKNLTKERDKTKHTLELINNYLNELKCSREYAPLAECIFG